MDHFEVFGLPRRLAIDTAELQRKFYELSRRHHPDFHQTAPPEEQARALEASARLNAAYRALRDPTRRTRPHGAPSRPPARQAGLAAMKESLASRASLRTVIDDLTDALGENQEGYVTNRRH